MNLLTSHFRKLGHENFAKRVQKLKGNAHLIWCSRRNHGSFKTRCSLSLRPQGRQAHGRRAGKQVRRKNQANMASISAQVQVIIPNVFLCACPQGVQGGNFKTAALGFGLSWAREQKPGREALVTNMPRNSWYFQSVHSISEFIHVGSLLKPLQNIFAVSHHTSSSSR